MDRRTRSLSRARRALPAHATLVDVLAEAYRANEAPDAVARDLLRMGVEARPLQHAMVALVVHHVISGLSTWPAEVRECFEELTA
jgi:hypothetical protein